VGGDEAPVDALGPVGPSPQQGKDAAALDAGEERLGALPQLWILQHSRQDDAAGASEEAAELPVGGQVACHPSLRALAEGDGALGDEEAAVGPRP